MNSDYKITTQPDDNRNFCTCPDLACPNNPANSMLGCTPCVEVCLAKNEIPSCFFRKQQPNMDRKQDYSFEGFAKFTLNSKK